MASASALSTPSRRGTAARNSVNFMGKTRDDVDPDVKSDVELAKKASFTAFLRLFLSRCLSGAKKVEFAKLQWEIEALQNKRFDQSDSRQSSRGLKEAGADSKPTTGEQESVKTRDELLGEVLQESLKAILPTANNPSIRDKLCVFAALIADKSLETDRYSVYAEICNSVLDELAKLNIPFLRGPDPLSLRLCRADPIDVTSTYAGVPEKVVRRPDFAYTSLAAARVTHLSKDFGAKPSTGFKWPQILSCCAVKASKYPLSNEARSVTHKPHQFKENTSLDDASTELDSGQPKRPSPIENMLGSQPNTGSKSKRTRSKSSANNKSGSKKCRVSESGAAKKIPGESDANRNVDARIQVAGYAMEMMSSGPGVLHVINMLVVDEYLYLWYCDRQGLICSNGISIIANFPLFLCLQLAFQRFAVEDWGVVPWLNPEMLNSLQIEGHINRNTTTVELSPNSIGFRQKAGEPMPVRIQLAKYLSAQPHCLSGRMTSVFEAEDDESLLACKIYSPEVQRTREDAVLLVANEIAKKREPEMRTHLPRLRLSGDLCAGDTLRVRSVLGIPERGHRTLRIVVTNRLESLTSQTDAESVIKAWLDIVNVHAFLWGHGIEHGDPSLWNAMIDPVSKRGVLNDYDLSVIVWLQRVPGTDRTGTIPFMALELLTHEYWKGNVRRYYHHELEALVWVLMAIFIAWNKGTFQPMATEINGWFTSDYVQCRKEKVDFCVTTTHSQICSLVHPDFLAWKELIIQSTKLIEIYHTQVHKTGVPPPRPFFGSQSHSDDCPVETFENSKTLLEAPVRTSVMFREDFVTTLSKPVANIVDICNLRKRKPNLVFEEDSDLFKIVWPIIQQFFRNVAGPIDLLCGG